MAQVVDKSEQVILLARLGYVARGAVYGLLGYLALSSAGTRTIAQGQQGALAYIQDIPGGTVALYAAAAGLLGYSLFRLSTALLDTERHGIDAKGIAVRIGHACSALVHLGLCWTALQLALGAHEAASSGSMPQDMAHTLLSLQLGELVLGLVGVALVGAAVFQARSAVTLGFMKRMSPRAPAWTCWLGRIGYATRALVFAAIGWSIIRSAWFERSEEVRSLGSAILNMRQWGPVYAAVAIGLILFGLFSLIMARYRIIPDPGQDLKALKHKLA